MQMQWRWHREAKWRGANDYKCSGGDNERQSEEAQTMQMQWRWHGKANGRGINNANAMDVTMRGKVERRKRCKCNGGDYERESEDM